MPSKLEGKVAIVTGGGWNIGRAISRRFAREGARVVLCGRREEPLAETAALIHDETGQDAWACRADVTDAAAMKALVVQAVERFGTVDTLAAIAGGGGSGGAVDEIDPGAWEEIVRVNLFGTFCATHAVLPILRAKNAGTIVTCLGGGAYFPLLDAPATAYACAKAAISRFTDQLAVELMGTGVRINALGPSQTLTPPQLAAIEEEEHRTGTVHPAREHHHSPEEAAELALWLASDDSAPLCGRSVSTSDRWWRDPEKVRAVCASPHAYTLRRAES